MPKAIDIDTTSLRHVDRNGYWMVYVPDHEGCEKSGPYKNWEYEHRYVMEMHLGRLLTHGEVVHHINEDRKDNRIENLAVMTSNSHAKHHFWNVSLDDAENLKTMKKGTGFCCDCGKRVSAYATRCTACNNKHYGKLSRSYTEEFVLELSIEVMNVGYSPVARKLGMSDNGLRHMFQRYGFTPVGRRRFACPLPATSNTAEQTTKRL